MSKHKAKRGFYGPIGTGSHKDKHEVPPDPMTRPCLRFFQTDATLKGFLAHHSALLVTTQILSKHGDKIYINVDDKNIEGKIAKGFDFIQRTSPKLLVDFHQVLSRMAFSYVVDNFLTYVSDLLALIFRTKPEALRSSQMIKFEDILKHQSMPDLIGALADRRVQTLAYKGMPELNDELSRALGLPLFPNERDLHKAVNMVELRNLIVHNRSVVNQTFLSRIRPLSGVKTIPLSVGHLIPLDFGMLLPTEHFLAKNVTGLDRRATRKFGLPRPISRRDCGL